MRLFDYQQAAVEAAVRHMAQRKAPPGLIVMPTGAGKSVVIAALATQEAIANRRTLILTHRVELLRQNLATLRAMNPGVRVGVYSAALHRFEGSADIVVASIDSLRSSAGRLGRIHTVVVDEAHLLNTARGTRYAHLLHELAKRSPSLRVIGLTATPYRLDCGRIDGHDRASFPVRVLTITVDELVARGVLAPVVSVPAPEAIDTEGLQQGRGDWKPEALGARAMTARAVNAVVSQSCTKLTTRRHWLCFAVSVAHGERLVAAFEQRGIATRLVHGAMPAAERASALASFREGTTRCVVNVNVLTTGYDFPALDAIILARPTQSLGIYVQMVGRGMRRAPEKANCLVLDFGGNIARHGPLDALHEPEPGPTRPREGASRTPDRAADSFLFLTPSKLPLLAGGVGAERDAAWNRYHRELHRAGYGTSADDRVRHFFAVLPAHKYRCSVPLLRAATGINGDSLRAALRRLVASGQLAADGTTSDRVYWVPSRFGSVAAEGLPAGAAATTTDGRVLELRVHSGMRRTPSPTALSA